MAFTLSTMQTEFQARGFADMTVAADLTRITRWLNDAMHDIDEMYDWPYLQTSTTGTAPLTIADLRKVERVIDTSHDQPLPQLARSEAAGWDGDLTTTGTSPLAFYVTNATTVSLYPVSSTTQLQVLYWKFGADLASAGDAPLMPDRFRMAIVDYAVAYGCIDRGDVQGAQIAQQAGDTRVARMADSFGVLEPSATFIPAVGDDC
jgi:hypothetical protein